MFGLQITCAAFNFLIWIAPPEEIRVLTLDLQSILAEIVANYDLNQLHKILYDARHVA